MNVITYETREQLTDKLVTDMVELSRGDGIGHGTGTWANADERDPSRDYWGVFGKSAVTGVFPNPEVVSWDGYGRVHAVDNGADELLGFLALQIRDTPKAKLPMRDVFIEAAGVGEDRAHDVVGLLVREALTHKENTDLNACVFGTFLEASVFGSILQDTHGWGSSPGWHEGVLSLIEDVDHRDERYRILTS